MNNIKLSDYAKGYVTLSVEKADINKVVSALYNSNITFKTLNGDNKYFYLSISIADIKKAKKILRGFENIKYTYNGLTYLISKYKARPGIFIGLILSIAVIMCSSSLIWDIEIKGNKKLSDENITKMLESYGLHKGAFVKSVDLDNLHQEVLIDNGSIGWLRVNFRGTSAIVEVIEYEPPEKLVSTGEPSNIVAKRDGMVLSSDIRTGTSSVISGELVKKGDLLISGIVDSTMHGYTLKSADGEVFAQVVDQIIIEIPYRTEIKSYTGNTFIEKNIEFWGKNIKLYKNSGNKPTICDIIERKEGMELFNLIKLPIDIEQRIYNEYELQTVLLSKEEAKKKAIEKLNKSLTQFSSLGDLLSTKVSYAETETSFILNATVYHTEQIGKRAPIATTQSYKQEDLKEQTEEKNVGKNN